MQLTRPAEPRRSLVRSTEHGGGQRGCQRVHAGYRGPDPLLVTMVSRVERNGTRRFLTGVGSRARGQQRRHKRSTAHHGEPVQRERSSSQLVQVPHQAVHRMGSDMVR